MSPWTNFSVVVCAQLLFFLFLARKKRAAQKITPGLVIRCLVGGVLFGIAFDVLMGWYLGIFDYALHFQPLFLVVNGALSYGLWLLTLQLLRSERFLSFYAWTVVIGLLYEIVNYFFPVWSWTFGGGVLYQESVVILVAYCGLGILAALAAPFATHTRFRAFQRT